MAFYFCAPREGFEFVWTEHACSLFPKPFVACVFVVLPCAGGAGPGTVEGALRENDELEPIGGL